MEGIERAKAEGIYKGRPCTIDAERVRSMREGGMSAIDISKALGIGRASVYRVLQD